MLEDLKSFYAKMFTYRGEAVAREVYNPLVVSVAVGIFFAIGNSFASGYVTKWIVGVATVVWGVATLLSLWAVGVRRVTWLRRPVAVLVIAALCAVCGAGLWLYGFGVPSLLGGVLRPFWGYVGVGLLALGAVVWCVTVLPSKGMTSAQSGGQAHRGSRKPSQSKAPRHVVAKQADKGRHTARSTEQVEAQQFTGQTAGQASSQTGYSTQSTGQVGYSNQVGHSTQSEYSSNSGLLTL